MGAVQEAAHALKCCLSNVALNIICTVDQDFKEMRQQLGGNIWKTADGCCVEWTKMNKIRSRRRGKKVSSFDR